MSGEAEKVVQQDQAAVPAPVVDPPSENHDVEMSEAPAAKEPEQPAQPIPVDAVKPSLPAEPPAEAPKEALTSADAVQEDPKPAETISEPAEHISQATSSASKPAVTDGDDKASDVGPQKPTEGPTERTTEGPTDKVEAAEDASAKMLAANLETPSNGELTADPTETEADTKTALENGNDHAVIGEKRKAEDSVGANGDPNKKPNVETAPDMPTTNGSAPARKLGRPKKEKKLPAPVGKTARRTRSQGAPDL